MKTVDFWIIHICFSFSFLLHACIIIFECHSLINIYYLFALHDILHVESHYILLVCMLCVSFSLRSPAVLKAFPSNIWWGAYRVIASYRWPTQCRASLQINGPTRRIQWQGKEHSTSSLSMPLTDEFIIQSLNFPVMCPCSFRSSLMKQYVTLFYHSDK